MMEFGKAAFIGLCVGLIWEVGCALVLLYSIYLAGYRKAIEDSLAPGKSRRFKEILAKIQARRSAEKA